MPDGPKINLGSWAHAPEDWINIDGSWNAWLSQRPRLRRAAEKVGVLPDWASDTEWPENILVHDLRKPLPFPDGYAGAIYGSHVLEHLYLVEAVALLGQCRPACCAVAVCCGWSCRISARPWTSTCPAGTQTR